MRLHTLDKRRSSFSAEIRLVSKERLDHGSLAGRGLDLVDGMPERAAADTALAVPGDVLARYAHAQVFAVEGIQIFQVAEQNGAHLERRRVRAVFFGFLGMFGLAENTPPALGV